MRIDELAEIVMGQSPASTSCNSSKEGYPLLNGPTEFGAHHPVPQQWTTAPTKLAATGDLLFCVRGSTTGRMNWADRQYVIGRGLAALRHRGGGAFQPYLRGAIEYRLSDLLSAATGSTFPNVSRSQVAFLEVPDLTLTEQLGVAEMLGALDDKIELNERINATLDEMARALFKSWFVNFDPVRAKAGGRQPAHMDAATAALFPSSFEDSALGPIPAGWRVSTIGEIAEVIDCLHSKKPARQDAGQLLLQLSNVKDDGLIDTSDSYWISEDDYAQWTSRMEAREGDCVITNVGRVGAVGQVPTGLNAALGRNMTGIRTNDAFPHPTFLVSALLSEAMRDEIAFWTDSGSVMDSLNVRSVPKLRYIMSDLAVVEAFESLARPLRRLMETNRAESRTLGELRDALLPRLISGEIRVGEAARTVAVAG